MTWWLGIGIWFSMRNTLLAQQTARHVPVLCSKYGAKHRSFSNGVSHNFTSVLAAQMIGQVDERNANRDGSRYSELSPIRKRNERKRLGKKRGGGVNWNRLWGGSVMQDATSRRSGWATTATRNYWQTTAFQSLHACFQKHNSPNFMPFYIDSFLFFFFKIKKGLAVTTKTWSGANVKSCRLTITAYRRRRGKKKVLVPQCKTEPRHFFSEGKKFYHTSTNVTRSVLFLESRPIWGGGGGERERNVNGHYIRNWSFGTVSKLSSRWDTANHDIPTPNDSFQEAVFCNATPCSLSETCRRFEHSATFLRNVCNIPLSRSHIPEYGAYFSVTTMVISEFQ